MGSGRRRTTHMSKATHYLEFFGSDALKRLHGCAIAEADRGPESPCAGLARPLRRPQVGFGNPHAGLVFLSPSPIDPASAANEAFSEWLERESSLVHHMTSQTVQPYFRFVQAVLRACRERWGQKPQRNDTTELAFHTSAVRCASENPDRVTEAALDQCVERHLTGMLDTLQPRLVVAMGGAPARYFWARSGQDWEAWGSMERLHGTVLQTRLGERELPVVLSVHPFQRDVELHPEVIGRVVAQTLGAGRNSELKAA
jgi:hypothetical protein